MEKNHEAGSSSVKEKKKSVKMKSQNHSIIEYIKLEGTHKDH